MRRLRTVFATLTLFGATAAAGTSVFVTALVDRDGLVWWPIARGWAWSILKSCGLRRLAVRNREGLQREGVILMANHESHMDPPALMWLTTRPPVRFLTKHTLFRYPFLGWGMWAMGMVSINRTNQKKAFQSIDRAARMIEAGKTVLVFPEGTRSSDGHLLPFKKGGFVMATQRHVPIVPVGIAGTQDILPKGWNWVSSSDVAVVVGDPIDTSPYDPDNKDDLMLLVRERIEALREEARELLAEM
ncbi:MAG: lysophospholipid acyltransferase family protein [Myxococcota bacterium]